MTINQQSRTWNFLLSPAKQSKEQGSNRATQITLYKMTYHRTSVGEKTFLGLLVMHSSSCKHDISSLHATNTMPLSVSSPSANTSSLNVPCFCLSSSTSSRTSYNDIIRSRFILKYPTFIKLNYFPLTHFRPSDFETTNKLKKCKKQCQINVCLKYETK